jgi:hypothetical protein
MHHATCPNQLPQLHHKFTIGITSIKTMTAPAQAFHFISLPPQLQTKHPATTSAAAGSALICIPIRSWLHNRQKFAHRFPIHSNVKATEWHTASVLPAAASKERT